MVLNQELDRYRRGVTPPDPPTALLGAWVDGAFRILAESDPSLAFVRKEDGSQTTVKHHNRIDIHETQQDVLVVLGKDAQGYDAIIELEAHAAGAVLETNPAAAGGGVSRLNDLSDVDTSGGATGDVLTQQSDGSFGMGTPVPLGKYRQFVYAITGSGTVLLVDGSGYPVTMLLDLE